MKIILHRNRLPHSFAAESAFLDGLKAHGQAAAQRAFGDAAPCDLAVFWGHHQETVIRRQREAGANYLVIETGYLGDRLKNLSLGYNGLNGRADFMTEGADGSRFERFAHLMKPWRAADEGYFLIMGQVSGDASLRGLDIFEFYRRAAAFCAGYGEVAFRPHPRAGDRHLPRGAQLIEGELGGALAGARCAVTLNSNSGVDAALAGVPVIALDVGSMAWEIAGHTFGEALCPPRPDRTAWANRLAFSQWTLEEISSGQAWERLKNGPTS